MSKRHKYPQWWVYIVQCDDDTYYTGISHDINHRIEQHNSGKGAAYTRSHGPVELVYYEKSSTHSHALKREYEIKKLSHSEKKAVIDKFLVE